MRAIVDAKRREDFAALVRIHQVPQSFIRSSNFNDKAFDALKAYAAGLNQHEAGEYLLAVVSLQQALKTGSDLVPVKKAGELLETIRKDHPAEFGQGMIEFLAPRSAQESRFWETRAEEARSEESPILPGGSRTGGAAEKSPLKSRSK